MSSSVVLSGTIDGKPLTVRLETQADGSISETRSEGTRRGRTQSHPGPSYAPLSIEEALNQFVDDWLGKGLNITGDSRVMDGPFFTAKLDDVSVDGLDVILERFGMSSELADGSIGRNWRLRRKGDVAVLSWRFAVSTTTPTWSTVDHAATLIVLLSAMRNQVPLFQVTVPPSHIIDVPGVGRLEESVNPHTLGVREYLADRRPKLASELLEVLYDLRVFNRPFDAAKAFESVNVAGDPFAVAF